MAVAGDAQTDLHSPLLHGDDEEEGDCCRICRCGATEDDSLFYPCKCSGSIKYVHQQCLIDWLGHSGNTHCEVCKHKFSFTPVYAKDAPSKLPWHELAIGLLKRAAAGIRVAHRVWLVSCVWLILVPWVTCLVWRLAFLRSFAEVHKLLLERCNVLAVATDCIQGSLLSIGIVFLNIAVSSLKQQLKAAITTLEHQLVRQAVPGPAPVGLAAAVAAPAAGAAEQQQEVAAEEAAPDAAAAVDPPAVEQHAVEAAGQLPEGQQQQAAGAADANAVAAAAAGLAAAVAAAEAILGEDGAGVIDANEADEAAADDPDDWGDVPFEELLGLQGPWLSFLETIALVVVGNTFFMAGVVYLPLNIGRLLLTAARRACSTMSIEQQQMLQQLLTQHVQIPYVQEFVQFVLSILAPAAFAGASNSSVAANATAISAAAAEAASSISSNITTAVNATAAVLVDTAATAAAVAPATADTAADLGLMSLSLDTVMKEIHAQLELPPKADFLALGLGHCLLVTTLLVGLWLYMSVRLWRAVRRRMRRNGQRSLLQVIRSTGRWLLTSAAKVAQGVKLVFLLSIELGAFPLAAGLWLDICALPLTSTSLGQRGELLAKTPFIAGFMHWVLGVGFLLGFTFLVCVVREVLRPGALPFIRDPTNPDRNPIREMLDEPLFKHLGRVAFTWVVYAGLSVVLVHLPALLAKALVPSLYPLRVALFDPLTQIPADMLLLHILIPFTVEHVRGKAAVKAAVTTWLRYAGRLLGWSGYLLPASETRQPAAQPAVPAAVAAPPAQAAAAVEQRSEAAEAAVSDSQLPTAEAQNDAEDKLVQGAAASTSLTTEATAAAAAVVGSGDQGQSSSIAAAGAVGIDQREQQQGVDNEITNEQQPLLQRHGQQQQQQPVDWYHQQPNYSSKLAGLVLLWLLTAILINLLMITLPVGLGRTLFSVLGLPFKNDLFTGMIGLLALWGSYTLAAGVATSANLSGVKAVVVAAWKWLVLAGQVGLLLVLWLGVVATMIGMLCELILLPLRVPPNQTALIYLYQDWTMGVLALKLLHLMVMVTPRREGRPPPDPDSFQGHFDAIQAGGLRNLDFHRALTKIVLPVLLLLSICLAVPCVVSRGVLPLLGLPENVLQYANLYAYAVFHGLVLLYVGSRRVHSLAVQLHNAIRDDKYLVGRQLNNFELQQQQRELERRMQDEERQRAESAAGVQDVQG